jgi:hypothetical protein
MLQKCVVSTNERRRLEGWHNTAARLAGRSDPAGCYLVHAACPDGPHHSPRSDKKCTQNTVMSYVTQGRHGLVL